MIQTSSSASPFAAASFLGLVFASVILFGSPFIAWPMTLYPVQVAVLVLTVVIGGVGLYRVRREGARLQVETLLFGWSCSLQIAAQYLLEAQA